MKRKKPNLFIVGKPRSGTSSLYLMLKQHPGICMSKEKEPHYFDEDVSKRTNNKKDYMKFFSNVKHEKIIGEATPNYLVSEKAAKEIKKFNPNSKIIMILREPLDFLRALYQKAASSGNEELGRVKKDIFKKEYLEKIKYSEQIKRYLDNFPKKNIKIIIYDDYKNNNEETLKEIFRFLRVDENFKPGKETINPSRFNRFGKINVLLKSQTSVKIRKAIRKSLPKSIVRPLQKAYRKAIYKNGRMEIPSETRGKLKKQIKPEVEKVDDLLHKEGFLDKKRSIVKEWGYDRIK